MSLNGLYLGNPSADSILFVHMERTYIEAVQSGVNFDFSQVNKKEKSFEILRNYLYKKHLFNVLFVFHREKDR